MPEVLESVSVSVGAEFTSVTVDPNTNWSNDLYIKNTSSSNGGYYRMLSSALQQSGGISTGNFATGQHYVREYNLDLTLSDSGDTRLYGLYSTGGSSPSGCVLTESTNAFYGDPGSDSGLIKQLSTYIDPYWASPAMDSDVSANRPSGSHNNYRPHLFRLTRAAQTSDSVPWTIPIEVSQVSAIDKVYSYCCWR